MTNEQGEYEPICFGGFITGAASERGCFFCDFRNKCIIEAKKFNPPPKSRGEKED